MQRGGHGREWGGCARGRREWPAHPTHPWSSAAHECGREGSSGRERTAAPQHLHRLALTCTSSARGACRALPRRRLSVGSSRFCVSACPILPHAAGPAWRTRTELTELLYRAQPRDARGLNPDEVGCGAAGVSGGCTGSSTAARSSGCGWALLAKRTYLARGYRSPICHNPSYDTHV